MDNLNLGPAEPAATPDAPRRFGRTKRVAVTVAAAAVLLGSGAAIGIAATGGAAASTSGNSSGNGAAAGVPSAMAAKCALLAAKLRSSGHPAMAMHLHALCTVPLLRLALVGGEYGQVTFSGKTAQKTLAFERGTVKSVNGSTMTVTAPDGTTWTWELTASTLVQAAHQPAGSVKPATGDRVFVGGPVVSGVKDARLIRVGGAS